MFAKLFTRTNWKKEALEWEAIAEDLSYELEGANIEICDLEKEICDLEEEIKKLKKVTK